MSAGAAFPVPHPMSGERGYAPEPPRYVDVAALLDGGLPEAPPTVLLRRSDGVALFYAGQVNVIFGDPESGKTLLVTAAVSEALSRGQRVLWVDIDHNGPDATVARLLTFGAPEEALRDPERFRYAEPEDKAHLMGVVADVRGGWRPAVAVVDSIGELLPMMNLASNSPDDLTVAHSAVLKTMAMAGACVLAVDHLAKNTESRASGPTGTAAKRRTVGGISLRMTTAETFVPDKGGSAHLAINKDRHGGLRRHCPPSDAGSKEQYAGTFVLEYLDGELSWSVRAPRDVPEQPLLGVSPDDLAALDALEPPPSSVKDVKARMRWRTDRAADVLRAWRSRRSPTFPGNGERREAASVPGTPHIGAGTGNAQSLPVAEWPGRCAACEWHVETQGHAPTCQGAA
jgi:hypothetical protein